jgi:hypothetical protein
VVRLITESAFDLPVLGAVVDLCNNDQFSDCNDTQVERHTGFSQATVQASLRRLRESSPPVASFEEMDGRIMKFITQPRRLSAA